jgi:putative tricarboxylic transport membrane protein
VLNSFELALSIIWSIDTIVVLLAGVAIGTVVGAIPGMTAVLGVALVLPFTFAMAPVMGILLLLGIYKGSMYGGSISAIIASAPGTPAASCTVLDGAPMAQQGEARRALEMALYASCVADFISNLSLILIAGWLAKFALAFGPAEYFTLIVFSLTVVASVAGDDLLRGLVSAVVGLMAAMIGLDLIYGTERMVFGVAELMEGLNFVPVLIGLFALPAIIDRYAKRQVLAVEIKALAGRHVTRAEFGRCLKTILRGSTIGVVLGAIPGIGGITAAFLSYSEAKRTSDHPETFGKGEIEGVAAAESGNSGTAGATLIPLLALGIPGDVVTAVILGAFMIHGLRPGPIMFQENLDMILALFMAIMLSSVFLLVIGKFSIRVFSRVTEIPHNILGPAILVLCVFGVYSVNNSVVDILVMLVMGLVGYLMMGLRLPPAPFLIAFVLGPLLENAFRQSMLLSHGGVGIFFETGVSWVFWSLTAVSLGIVVRRRLVRDKRKGAHDGRD